MFMIVGLWYSLQTIRILCLRPKLEFLHFNGKLVFQIVGFISVYKERTVFLDKLVYM